MQKTVSEMLKTWYFLYSTFWLTSQWTGIAPLPTLLKVTLTHNTTSRFSALHLVTYKVALNSKKIIYYN